MMKKFDKLERDKLERRFRYPRVVDLKLPAKLLFLLVGFSVNHVAALASTRATHSMQCCFKGVVDLD